jgi:hypothetical protein
LIPGAFERGHYPIRIDRCGQSPTLCFQIRSKNGLGPNQHQTCDKADKKTMQKEGRHRGSEPFLWVFKI